MAQDKEMDELVERLKARGLSRAEVRQVLLGAVAVLDALPPAATDAQLDDAIETAKGAEALAEEHAEQHGMGPLPPLE